MRYYTVCAFLFLFPLWLVTTTGAQNNDERTFEISTPKQTYVLFEPMTVRFKAVFPREDYPADFKYGSVLNITSEDGVRSMEGFWTGTFPPPLSGYKPRPAFLGPTTTYEYDYNMYRLEQRFPRPGKYQIQFLLKKREGNLESNTVEITITEPTGVDKEALSFLDQFEDPLQFLWAIRKENGLELLETFVEKFGSSAYGDIAKYHLAERYSSLRDYNKAKTVLEELRSSSNPVIARNAGDQFRNVEANQAYDERPKKKNKTN